MQETSIYVASSWRNPMQPFVVKHLRDRGHTVYDFRNPAPGDNGFSWKQIPGAPDEPKWKAKDLHRILRTPTAQHGFHLDFGGMQDSRICVLLLPSGRSAHIEAGWFTGQGRPLIVLSPEPEEPELMYLLGGGVVVSSLKEMDEEIAAIPERTVRKTPMEIAEEAADTIETCGLHGEELIHYLNAFLHDCARDCDLKNMATMVAWENASRRYDQILNKRREP